MTGLGLGQCWKQNGDWKRPVSRCASPAALVFFSIGTILVLQQGMDVKRTKLGAAPARVPLQPTVVPQPQAIAVQPTGTQSTPSTVPSTVPTSLDTGSGALQEDGALQSYVISPQRCVAIALGCAIVIAAHVCVDQG